jgi:hypothetical protein
MKQPKVGFVDGRATSADRRFSELRRKLAAAQFRKTVRKALSFLEMF